MDRGTRLASLTDVAMQKMDEILNIPLVDDDPEYGRILSVQKDAATSVMNVQIKADENKFRSRASDALEGLLDLVRQHQAKTISTV